MKSIPSFRLIFSLILLSALALSGCNYGLPQQPTQDPGRIQTIVAGTLGAIPSDTPAPTNTPEPTDEPTATEPPAPTDTPVATDTPVPTDTEVPPTAVGLPTDTTVPAGGRIVFKDGGTTGSVQGNLPADGSVSFLLRALGGQLMVVSVVSPQDQAILSVRGQQGGQTLLAKSKGWINFRTYLPSNQQYALGVSSSVATSFLLTADVPARIRFETGAFSATVTGRASSGPNISYVLRASSGQTMTLEVDSANDNVYLAAYGYDTWNELVDPGDRLTEASFTLPKTEDYVVYAIQGSNHADFTLTVTIK
jgi:hypothetical protein